MKRRSYIILIYLLFATYSSAGQALELKDIFEIRNMDSLAVKRFCLQKDFELKDVDKDSWRYSYTYELKTNRHISFARTFPTDSSLMGSVYYYFENVKEYESLKKNVRKEGFRFKTVLDENAGSKSSRIVFYRGEDEFDLGERKIPGKLTTYFAVYFRRDDDRDFLR